MADHAESGSFIDTLEGIVKANFLWILLVVLAYFLWKYNLLYGIAKEVLPIIGTILLGRIAWRLWIHYIRQDFISGMDFVVLEIIPPRDVLRSPKAMELFITNAFYHMSNKGGREEFWQGAVWFWFSMEIASIDGQVHFYVRVPTRVRSLVETQMYAQFPQAQVKEVDDYTLGVDAISPKSSWMAWGCELRLAKPEAFPIKTYVDFGLDKDPKEEFKVDPISPLVELFGSLQKGEQMWMQIVVTPSKKRYKTHGTWFGKHDWVKESEVEIYKFMRPYTSTRESADEPGHYGTEIRVPTHLDAAVKAMSAKTSKLGFDTGIRLMYIAKKEVYSMNSRRNLRLVWRQYARPDSNQLERCNGTQGDAYSSIFAASSETVMMLADRMLHEYRERGFFHLPLRHQIFDMHNWNWPFPAFFTLGGVIKAYFHPPTFVLNTEELATLWHFPGQILKVPTLERIESKEAAPPTNLPI